MIELPPKDNAFCIMIGFGVPDATTKEIGGENNPFKVQMMFVSNEAAKVSELQARHMGQVLMDLFKTWGIELSRAEEDGTVMYDSEIAQGVNGGSTATH